MKVFLGWGTIALRLGFYWYVAYRLDVLALAAIAFLTMAVINLVQVLLGPVFKKMIKDLED